MSKAARIMELYDGIRPTSEIADIVGCRPEYVRVVARQRKGGGESDIDRRYLASSKGRRHLDANNVSRAVWARVLRETSDQKQLSRIWKKAYRKARDEGADTDRALTIAQNAKSKAACRLGDRKAASKAAAEARKQFRNSAATMEGNQLNKASAMRA